ncbi:MAG: FAD:protein FMN transferase [Atopostipes sp.]|nr:FAD:protein FMN transferase [Atopostipes sp.]
MEKSRKIRMMGTRIDLRVQHPRAESVLDELVSLLHYYEKLFSANDPESGLNKINQNAGIRAVQVDSELYELIKLGKKHSLAPSSLLNIAIGPLVQSWRIGFDDAKKPTDKIIKKELRKVDLDQVQLSENEVYLSKKGMAIDLGALAKGYIADRLIDYLKEVGATSALINLGGNLVTMGPAMKHSDGYWRIGVQNPLKRRGQSQIVLKIQDQSVVTSGIYERQLKKEGKSYHHILNPDTGYPVETDLVSLTIISDLSVDGEIWTSRLFGQRTKEAIQKIEEIPGIEGIVINQEGDIFLSKGVHSLL